MKVKCIYNKGNENRFTIGKVYDVHPDLNQSDLSGKSCQKFYCIINTDYGDSFTFQTKNFQIIEE